MTNGERQEGWLAQTLRLTVFPTASLPGTEGLWRRLTGEEPETEEQRKREGVHRQAGPHGEGELEVKVGLGRVDVIMSPLTTNIAAPAFYFGPFDQKSREFLELVRPWLADVGGDVVRVAFGGAALYPAEDRTAAYGLLGRHVPSLKVDPERSKEVVYRVNRPTTGSTGVDFNRITVWSSLVVKMHVGVPLGSTLTFSEQHFLRMEFDHNTVPEHTEPFPREQIVPIFEELVALALENAARGEIP